jgi:thioredoxin 1
MPKEVIDIDVLNWKEEVLDANELVVVEFWHPQCPYCRMLEPIYAKLAREYAGKLKFVKFNVMKNAETQQLAAKYGIMGTPTLKFICQGRPVQDMVGVLTEDYLRQGLEFGIKKHRDCAERSTPLSLRYIG